MPSVYKNEAGSREVRRWCSRALARADFTLRSATLATSVGPVELTSAGTGRVRVLLIPGTGFNAASALPWLKALSARWSTTVIDLPGQPGLSDPHRPHRARLAWYGQVLEEILEVMGADDVVLVGNSLGGAVVMAADSPRISARALISPAGIIRLSVPPKVLMASAVWLLDPTPAHTRGMLRWFVSPATELPENEVEWMSLMAARCRPTLAPPPLPVEILARAAQQPCVVGVGEHDVFLPARKLVPAVHRAMNLDVSVLPGVGHLTTEEDLDEVVSLIAEVAGQTSS